MARRPGNRPQEAGLGYATDLVTPVERAYSPLGTVRTRSRTEVGDYPGEPRPRCEGEPGPGKQSPLRLGVPDGP